MALTETVIDGVLINLHDPATTYADLVPLLQRGLPVIGFDLDGSLSSQIFSIITREPAVELLCDLGLNFSSHPILTTKIVE